jgi:hypothetical protein
MSLAGLFRLLARQIRNAYVERFAEVEANAFEEVHSTGAEGKVSLDIQPLHVNERAELEVVRLGDVPPSFHVLAHACQADL